MEKNKILSEIPCYFILFAWFFLTPTGAHAFACDRIFVDIRKEKDHEKKGKQGWMITKNIHVVLL